MARAMSSPWEGDEMDALPLLIFDHHGARFGVDARQVRESVWLPELTPVEEAPVWIVGLFSLRGQIIPVADLHLRFGHAARRYHTSDHLVVLESDGQPMGVIVSEVREVIDLHSDAIQSPPQFAAEAPGSTHLVAGEARIGDGLVTLLDVARLAHMPEGSAFAETAVQPAPADYFCPQATTEERGVFRKRAMSLQASTADEAGERLGLAVVELGGEYFGIALAAVQEFCAIAELSPIPCCPPHILGAMSLRGELLTLIDPRSALNLPPAASGDKVVVARTSSGLNTSLDERAVGIAVDQVHDVVYLPKEALQPPPAVLRELCGASIMGAAAYADGMMTLLDLPALLAREAWIVNEH